MECIFKTKQNKQNMNIKVLKCFEFLIKSCTALTIVMFSEYLKAEFPKRNKLQFKECSRQGSRNNCYPFVAVNWTMDKIMVWSFRNIHCELISWSDKWFINKSLFKSLKKVTYCYDCCYLYGSMSSYLVPTQI